MSDIFEQAVQSEKANVLSGFYGPLPNNPPLSEDEIEYLAKYKATAMIFEDGSDFGEWYLNFLGHREKRQCLVTPEEMAEVERKLNKS